MEEDREELEGEEKRFQALPGPGREKKEAERRKDQNEMIRNSA